MPRGSDRTPKLRIGTRSRRRFVNVVAGVFAVAGVAWAANYLASQVHAYAASAFVMVVKTDNPGTSNSTSFTIPTTGTGYSYNVDCNDDGTNEVTARTTSYTCIYAAAGTYTVAITGTFPRIYFYDNGDRQKLLQVKQWGTGAWTSMSGAFWGCDNLHLTATDAPNLSGVTDMSNMFTGAASMNEPIGSWNTASVTNMSFMFANALAFNQPLTNWNTAAVTDMSGMFSYATAFNQPLTNWNTGTVTNMSQMFSGAVAFNQPLDNWNTSKVTNMSGMFTSTGFKQPLDSWNVASVTDMSFMFADAFAFNQPLTNWNTAAVTDMSGMFSYATAFNQPLTNWNTAAVTNMSWMFSGAVAFNQPLDNWNTSKVTNMSGMFTGATGFSQPVGMWNISAVTDMSDMFVSSGYTAAVYDQTLAGFASQTVKPGVNFGVGQVTYCADVAHNILVNAPNQWVINDAGFCPPTINSPGDAQVVMTMAPTITGMAAPDRAVNIYLNGTTSTVMANSSGAYSFTPAALANGWYMAQVRSVDNLGNAGVTTRRTFYVYAHSGIAVSGPASSPVLSWSAAPNSQVGIVWHKVADGLPLFAQRRDSAVVAFQDKMWVFGGYIYNAATGTSSSSSDIWSSTDGINWEEVAVSSPWGNRDAHSVIEFNGKLWLLGGWVDDGMGYRNDIWSSTDGIHWTLEVQHAPWSELGLYPELAVLNNRLYLVDGNGEFDFVYSSEDGIVWKEEVTHAPFGARTGQRMVAFDGKLWLMGGSTNNGGGRQNDIWSSSNGADWVQEVAHAPWAPTTAFTTIVYDNRLWLMGGWGGMTEVWFSFNGTDWIRATEKADWDGRWRHAAVSHAGKLWIMGGTSATGRAIDDIWSTGIPDITYTVCWDTVQGGCAHSATTTNLSFTVPDELTKGEWYFTVRAQGADGQAISTYTANSYQVADPVPTVVPLTGKPVVPPLDGAAGTALDSALASGILSVTSHSCNAVQIPSIQLVRPEGIRPPQGNVRLLGGVEFNIACNTADKSADIALTLNTDYPDLSKLRAYKQSNGGLTDITSQVVFAHVSAGGTRHTVARYTIVDGGNLDEDGVANAMLVDPLFIGVVNDGGGLAATGENSRMIMAGAIIAIAVSAMGVRAVIAKKR